MPCFLLDTGRRNRDIEWSFLFEHYVTLSVSTIALKQSLRSQ